MIRKEFLDDQRLKRQNNSSVLPAQAAATTFVGNQRQMLHEIRESLSHLKKNQSMHIKSADALGLSNPSSAKNTRSTGYRQKALAEIRNSLQPYAAASSSSDLNGNSSSSIVGLPSSSSVASSNQNLTQTNGQDQYVSERQLQHLLQLGYDEETIYKALKWGGAGGHSIRWTTDSGVKSNETTSSKSEPINGLGHSGLPNTKVNRKPSFEARGSSPGSFIDGAASTRSDSPSLHLSRNMHGADQAARLTSAQSESIMYGSRHYAASLPPEVPPPLPPPRGVVNGPPPTPPRGTTPPPPPVPPMPQPDRSQQQYTLGCSQVHQMLRRLSPVSGGARPQVLPGHSSAAASQSGGSSVRATSPVSFSSRNGPMVVQNSPQAKQQLQQQLQALNIYHHPNSCLASPQIEPPPPYPIGSGANASAMNSSVIYGSSGSSLSRQSPTPPSSELSFGSSSVGSASSKRQPPPSYQSHFAIGMPQPISSSSAIAMPVSSHASTPQARSARQTKTQPPIIMQSVKSTQVQKPVLQTAIAPISPAPAVNSSNNGPHRVEAPAATVPTTDPPSYVSSVQALAAQRANPSPCVTNASVKAPTPTPSEAASSVDSISTSSLSSSTKAHHHHPHHHHHQQHPSVHRKMSPVDTVSMMCRSESPVSLMSNITCTSSPPSTQSDSTQDSGIGRGNGPKQLPSEKEAKVTHQSPIPQRKAQSREKDEERRDSKVRNYSPAAYKFYMEQHFENLLKSHKERELRRHQLEGEMDKVSLSEDARHQMRLMLHQKESNYIRLKRAKMDKSMFKKIKTIGVGAFGEVALVNKINTTQYYAMKTLRKSDVLKRNQVAHVKAERDILAEADNEWVVKLYYSFQDKDNLYFVMDYIAGGDLMSLLIKFGIFNESLAKFYIAELLLAIESVHKMGFIHRDIKPDNILIDKDGHIKLTDFGLCTGFRWTHNSKYYQNGEHQRQDSMDLDENWLNECRCITRGLKPLERRRRREHQRCLAHSLVGTPNYIAPEVLMRTGYTQLCDWWSVGVILYEMLVGQPPFLANTPAETQFKVINWETSLKIPKQANLTQDAKALILKLCCGPNKRLGRSGADEIKNHQFFSSIDFEKGLRRQQAPYIPNIRCPTDTSNFDPIDPERLHGHQDSSSSSGDGSGRGEGPGDTASRLYWFNMGNKQENEHGFFEFTFRRFFDDGGHAYPSRLHITDESNANADANSNSASTSSAGAEAPGPDPVYV